MNLLSSIKRRELVTSMSLRSSHHLLGEKGVPWRDRHIPEISSWDVVASTSISADPNLLDKKQKPDLWYSANLRPNPSHNLPSSTTSPKGSFCNDPKRISITMRLTAPSQLSVRVSSPSFTTLTARLPRIYANQNQLPWRHQQIQFPIHSSA
jgi:hypothetical protein